MEGKFNKNEGAYINETPLAEGDKIDLSNPTETAAYIRKLEDTIADLESAFNNSHDGIVICHKNGAAKRYNEAYCRLTGINGNEILDLPMQELISKNYLSESATLLAIQTRKTATTMPKVKSGRKVMITSVPTFDANGEIIRVIANVRDITELMSLKSQMEKVKELSERYYSEILHLRSESSKIDGFVSESPVMKSILSAALKVARTNATVLITGESGAGKEVLARAIHNSSELKAGPFVKVNCGAIPGTLLESELFGYEKGAFTNASQSGKTGVFEIAIGGTLFLDEIGEIPLALQAKLLGVLQDMKFTRVGGTKEIALKARVIAATNRELEEMIKQGQFRKDLYYRINVVNLKIPPLLERKGDIFPLADYFLKKFNDKYRTFNTFSPQVINAFMKYHWPGNVREMENLIERLVILAPNEQLTLEMLPNDFREHEDTALEIPEGSSLKGILAELERRILQTLVNRGYSSYMMARKLGINQSTVVRKLKKLGINE